MKCGLVEKRAKKTLPPCESELVKGICSVHCRARLRGERKGKLCVNHHLKGRKGCRMHLGKRSVGMAHHNYQSGEFSRYIQVLDPQTAERYKAMQSSPDYLSLSPDIYAAQMRIDEVLARARTGETGTSWKKARESFNAFLTAQEAKNRPASVAALAELRAALDAGNKEREAWDEVGVLWTRLQRLVESQRRRAIEHGELVALAVVLTILRTSAESIRRHLFDADIDTTIRDAILGHVSADLGRITGGAISGMAIPGSKQAGRH
jgi:hypothetical protein